MTDSGRIAAELGWVSSIEMAAGIVQTMTFYKENPWYLSSI
jgi:dTDP-D-glucose 4,6-dehydratase